MTPSWRWIAPIALAVSIQCSRTTPKKTAEPLGRATLELFEIVNVDGQTTLREWKLGPSMEYLDRLQLDKVQKVIDSTLMPRADPATREKLASIKSIIERAQRNGPAFLNDPHNLLDIGNAPADLVLIIAAMAPDEFEAQVHVPAILLMTVASLENLRGEVEIDADIGRYQKDALTFARRNVERFPHEARAYGELAFVRSLTGGTKEEMRKLYKRCTELDSSVQYCKEGLRMASE